LINIEKVKPDESSVNITNDIVKSNQSKRLFVGSITAAQGLNGLVRVYSWTDPVTNLFNYKFWFLVKPGSSGQAVNLLEGKQQGRKLIARIEGCQTREKAEALVGYGVEILQEDLPDLAEDDYYWHQLEGLEVYAQANEYAKVVKHSDNLLGKIRCLMQTGSNDVMVVVPTKGSIDNRERLLPFLPGQVVNDINLASGYIGVVWDPEF